jgi:anti-sigma factor RsiW
MDSSPITERELHAYVDGQLDATRRAEIEAHLVANSGALSHVQQLRDQIQGLHQEYDEVLNEPVPAQLSQVLRRRTLPRGLAASVAGLLCGAVVGWFAHSATQSRDMPPVVFARDALAAHVLFVDEKRHPVEVSADQEAHLVAWLSKRLDAPIHAPILLEQGFSLLGGRLLPGSDAPLAQLMYESKAGERLTLTVRHASQPVDQTGFQVLEKGGTSVFYWIDQQYGYALSGNIGKQKLLAVAQSVELQLKPR